LTTATSNNRHQWQPHPARSCPAGRL